MGKGQEVLINGAFESIGIGKEKGRKERKECRKIREKVTRKGG